MVRLQDEPIADPVSVRSTTFPSSREERRDRVPGRRGCRRALLRLPVMAHTPPPPARRRPPRARLRQACRLAALAAAGRERTRPYEFLRRGAADVPVFWGGAEAFTETQKQRLLGPELRAEVGDLTRAGTCSPDPAALRGGRLGPVAPELDDLSRPPPAPARAPPRADRPDVDGRRRRGARAVPRPRVRASSRCRSPPSRRRVAGS